MTWLTPEIGEVSIRLGTATIIGAVIGLNRHLHGQPAGLRTHALVSVAAALAILVFSPLDGSINQAVDAQARVLQGIVTGVGFIGAGVILHEAQGHKIYGLTTAAAIWITAIFGALCGRGHIAIALIGFAIAMLMLIAGPRIEDFAVRISGRDATKLDSDPDR
jgi:putative Mg2+ transporter-C (MgtC) family protein